MAIVLMKKVLFVTLEKRANALLRALQKLGVLHPDHIKHAAESEKLNTLEHKLHVQSVVIKALESRKTPDVFEDVHFTVRPDVAHVESWVIEEKKIAEDIARIEKAICRQSLWGEFKPEDIAKLRESSIYVQLWEFDAKEFDRFEFPKKVVVRVVDKSDLIRFVTVTKGGAILLDGVRPVDIPERGLNELYGELSELKTRARNISNRVVSAKKYLKTFKDKNKLLIAERDFYETLDRAFDEEGLVAFSGWVPAEDVEDIKKSLCSTFEDIVIRARDVHEDENPPIKTKNGWLARTFEPLLHILGYPKYRGIDPALFFAPFMMLFFGVCLGDAGYGFLMIIAAFAMRKLKGLRNKISGLVFVSNMTILFGLMTVIFGLITGSIFGISFFDRSWVPLDVSPATGNPMLLFKISIALGVIHLSITFMMAFVYSKTVTKKISKLGLLCVLWGGTLGIVQINYWWVLMSAGLFFTLFFSSVSKNLFLRLGAGLWNIYGLTGLLGDVMSYARLFGLGIATAAIASVVNMLAGEVRPVVPVLGYVFAIAIIIVGHGFNLALSIVSALVHPVRLHAVESFPKCVELTGLPYKPLSKG